MPHALSYKEHEAGRAKLTAPDFDKVLSSYQLALGEFVKGNPEPNKKIFSHEKDVILFNPHIFISHGWTQVVKALDSAASKYSDGVVLGFETLSKVVAQDIAYVIWIEKYESKIGEGAKASPVTLRVTNIFRHEKGLWKLVHRHAVPITSIQSVESVAQRQRY